MKHWNIFVLYLRDKLGICTVIGIAFLVMSFIFHLYGYALSAVLYAFLISLIILSVYGAYKFLKFHKSYMELYRIQHNINELSSVISSGTCKEKLLIESIHYVTAQINEMNIKNTRKEKEADTYYSMWVHQIKVPISAMHLLLQSNKTPENRLLGQELFKIEQYANMALGYLRIESMYSDLQLEKADMHSVISLCIKKFAPTFIYKKLYINLHDFDNQVITDKKWLSFVFEQLLSNALKYTNNGGIEIYMDSSDTLYIKDTGIGIAPDDLPRIFERGFTGSNGRIDKNATGLGLFLADKVMRWLKHGLEINSKIGDGTVCILRFKRDALWDSD